MCNRIQRLEDEIGEWMSANIVLVCTLLIAGVGVLCLTGHGNSWLLPCGGVIGGCMVMYQWYSDRRIKRSELLRELVVEFNKYNVEELLRDGDGDLACEEETLFDLLTFLTHVCHLNLSLVLSKEEYNSLKWDILKVLQNIGVFNLIKEVYNGREIDDCPYHDLLKVAVRDCKEPFKAAYSSLLKHELDVEVALEVGHKLTAVKERGQIVDWIGSGRTYKNHLEVLNGIFNLGYLAHMRGGARLLDGTIVWFPKFVSEGARESVRIGDWTNELSKDGKVMVEIGFICRKDLKYHVINSRRIVFGMDVGKSETTYRFLGIFKLAKEEGQRYVYELTNENLLVSDVKNCLKKNDDFR